MTGRRPGELIGSVEVTPGASEVNFPAAARAWRILYVSTVRDNTDLQLVCGIVVAPSDPAKIDVATAAASPTPAPTSTAPSEHYGRMIAWSHATSGREARCQPSVNPSKTIWGDTPAGINVVAWGSKLGGDAHRGDSDHAILEYMIGQGWVVAATDYYASLDGGSQLQPYIVGKIMASNTLDSARAARQLLNQVYDVLDLDVYDLQTWGHSEGGHAAMWAAQLAEQYLAATKAPTDATFRLRGVTLLAPASNFIVQPEKQPYSALGYGLVDWETNLELGPEDFGHEIGLLPIGPVLMSLILQSWAQLSAGPAPDRAEMPAFPATGEVDTNVILTENATVTADEIARLCLRPQAERLAESLVRYEVEPFVLPELANGIEVEGLKHGNFDRACNSNPASALKDWCAWLTYNIPGPLGRSEMSKLPIQDGELVPIYIADGMNDQIIYCKPPSSTPDAAPDAKHCMSTALYESLGAAAYCPPGQAARGYLQFDLFREQKTVTPAGHFSVPGNASAADLEDPAFEGSPVQQFMDAAFARTLVPQCVPPRVMNPPGTYGS